MKHFSHQEHNKRKIKKKTGLTGYYELKKIIKDEISKIKKDRQMEPKTRKDIHEQLAETISARKKILAEWEKIFLPKPVIVKKDIHDQLKETIAELKREGRIWMQDKKAA
jgi:hypothetical protein